MNRNPLGDLGQGLVTTCVSSVKPRGCRSAKFLELAGVSNPYLSQIGRGLKKPSAEILNQRWPRVCRCRRVAVCEAGLLDQQDADAPAGPDTRSVIKADVRLTPVESTLLDIYDSFVGHSAAAPPSSRRSPPRSARPPRPDCRPAPAAE